MDLTIPFDAPDTLYYRCQYHDSMIGTFNITDVTGPQGFTGFQGFTGAQGFTGRDIKDLPVIKA